MDGPGRANNAGQEVITIYSWNVNGIDPLLQHKIEDFFARPRDSKVDGRTTPLSPLRAFLGRHGWPTLCFLQEVKIQSNNAAKLQQIRRAVSNSADPTSPDYEAHFCLPNRERYARSGVGGGKFYGVCTLVRKDFAHKFVLRCRSVDWDAEGRILIVETKDAHPVPRMAIINVYLVNGTDLPYRDHLTGEICGTRHDRKLQVHSLLQRECHQLEANGFDVVIAGDINVARTVLDGFPRLRESPIQHVRNRQDFEWRFMGKRPVIAGTEDPETPLGMIDTFRALHPDRRGYSYYSRAVPFGTSKDRVDMILASPSIFAACIRAGMHEGLADRATSDHMPIYAAFRFAASTELPPEE